MGATDTVNGNSPTGSVTFYDGNTSLGSATLASGKVDRKNLPPPRARAAEERDDLVPPNNDLEEQVVAVWEKLLAPTRVSVKDDFFRDLGGNSLLAALAVSELRTSPPFQRLSMLDIYQQPTAEKMAALFRPREG